MMDEWNRKLTTFVVTNLHPSFLLAVLSALVFVGVEMHEASGYLRWVVDKLGVQPGVWEGLLVLSAVTIVWARPTPLVAMLLTAPALLLGAYLLWYGLETHTLPPIVIIYLGWGFVITLVLTFVFSAIGNLSAADGHAERHDD